MNLIIYLQSIGNYYFSIEIIKEYPLVVTFIQIMLAAIMGFLLPKIGKYLNYLKRRHEIKHTIFRWFYNLRRDLYKTDGFISLHSLTKKRNYDALIVNNEFRYGIPYEKEKQLIDMKFGAKQIFVSNKKQPKKTEGFSKYYVIYEKNLIPFIKENFGEIENIEEFLDDCANTVAQRFLNDLREGKVRFNRHLYGVHSINESDSTILFYKSDYYTFKFIVEIYNRLNKINKDVFDITRGCQIPNKVPFFNSVGIGGFIIINRGLGDELVFAWRSDKSCESGGYWHFTYDETFTPDDCSTDDCAMLDACLERALKEELGITKKILKKCTGKNYGMIDCGCIRTDLGGNRYEFEVRSYARICLSDDFTRDSLDICFRFAKDAGIEAEMLKYVPIRELNIFIKNNKGKISPEALSLAGILKEYLRSGIIANDYDSYKSIIKYNSI